VAQAHLEVTDEGAGADRRTDRDGRVDRLVGRAGGSVVDHDDAAAGQGPGEGDRAG
jgi:hypothetical protein